MEAITANSDCSARCLPGHILDIVARQQLLFPQSRNTHRRPKPNATVCGFRTVLSSSYLPSCVRFRKRSGRNFSGWGYSSALWRINLEKTQGQCVGCFLETARFAHQIFPRTTVPFGMKYPSYSSSAIVQWGRPNVGYEHGTQQYYFRVLPKFATGCQRKTSRTIAFM